MSDLKSTPADRAAVLGRDWDGNGWQNTHGFLPADDDTRTVNDLHALLAELQTALVEGQKLIAEQARIGNLLAYVNLSDREVADYRDHPDDWSDVDPDEIADRRELAVQQILEGLGL